MTAHSPGPWVAHEPGSDGHILVTCPFGDVADVIAGPMTARLIAAAPTLLALVRKGVNAHAPGGGWTPDDLNDAIALIRRIEEKA